MIEQRIRNIYKILRWGNFVIWVFFIIPLTVAMNKPFYTCIMMSLLFITYWINATHVERLSDFSLKVLNYMQEFTEDLKQLRKEVKNGS